MRTSLLLSTASLAGVVLLSATASAATLTVGQTGEMFPTPCLAVAAASDNDVIEINAAGTYEKDFCTIDKKGLTLRGVGGGRAKINAKIEGADTLPPSDAIWLITADNVTIEKVEIFGAADAAKKTGAAIHQTGAGLTITDCSIHDNDSGVLVDDSSSAEVVVDKSELFNNGISLGDDPGHITVGKIAKLTVTSSYLHHGLRVTMVKSSAAENHILYNRITSESDGISRNSLDFPIGGLTYVIGNVFQRAVGDEDNRMVLYREGAAPFNKSDELFIVNNTFISDAPAIAIETTLDPAGGDTLPIVRNNIFMIPGGADPVAPKDALEASNYIGDPMFIDQGKWDLHLQDGSPCVDKGMPPGMGAGADLTPKSQYVHVASIEDRPVDDPIDIGAYEIPPPVPPGVGGGGGAGGSGAGVGGSGEGGQGGGASSASTGTGGAVPMEDTGCDCRAGDASPPQGAALAALAVAALYGARRRRRC